MKTVLFIDKQEEGLWSSFRKYDYLLNEYRGDEGFEVCAWNREGMSVDAAIPDLYQALGTQTSWQAVIVSDLRETTQVLRDDAHFDNPFDFRDRYEVQPGDGFVESAHPLVRLTQMLGGLPEKVFVDWQDKGARPLDLNALAVSYATTSERYELIERYRLGLPQPERIICVTPRDVDAAFSWARMQDFRVEADERRRSLETLVAARESALDSGQDPLSDEFRGMEEQLRIHEQRENAADLGFWERNDYPSNARFVVVDRLAPVVETPEGAQLAEEAASVAPLDEQEERPTRSFWFDFWMCVLALMVSTVEPQDLRAYELYRMDAVVDERALGYSFGRRRIQWETACRKIEERLDEDKGRLLPSEYAKVDLPDTQVSIPVTFDQVDPHDLYVDSSGVGIMKDRPQRDIQVWSSQRQGVMEQFRELLRGPRRALNIAADRFRLEKPPSSEELEYCILSQSEKERLRHDVQVIESSLVEGAGSRPFDYDASESDFDEADGDVREAIQRRATMPQALGVIGLALVTSLLGFGPYVMGATGGAGASAGAALVSLACLLALVVVFVVTLVRMRDEVRQTYTGFNDVMRRITAALNAQASVLSQRISGCASFRKKWAVLERQENLDVPTREADRLGRRSALLKTRIRDIDEVARMSDIDAKAAGYTFDITWHQLNSLLEDESFYNIRDLSTAQKHVGDGGTFSDAPYEFIRKLSLVPIKVA